ERREAWRDAKAAGTLRVTAAAAAPPAGWSGEQVLSPTADDWEPAIAADPSAPYVYLLATRYTGPTACGNQCPLPYHVLKISTDGGATWGADRYLCSCRGVQGQFDPEIEVVPSTGAVYAAWMNGYNVVVSKSANHGQTWTAPVPVYGNVSWNDKPILAVSDNGNDVYIAFNGPTGGDPYIAQSHDAGATWTQTKIVDSKRYIYAFDGDVLPNGTVVVSETSLLYANTSTLTGQDLVYVYRSTNVGATWSTNLVDTVEIGPNCTAAGCPNDYYPGHSAVSADANGNLVLLYDGATVSQGNESIWTRRSTDGGATWSGRQALSTSGEMGDFPSVEPRGAGRVRAWDMQTNGRLGAHHAWAGRRLGFERQEPDRRLRLGLDLGLAHRIPAPAAEHEPPRILDRVAELVVGTHARRVRLAEREGFVEERALDLVLQRGERRRGRVHAHRRLRTRVAAHDRHLCRVEVARAAHNADRD